MPLRSPTTIANHLTKRERIALFCAATDIDHASVGIPSGTMQLLVIRGLIARDTSTRRYVLRDTGRAVFRVLHERGGIEPEG